MTQATSSPGAFSCSQCRGTTAHTKCLVQMQGQEAPAFHRLKVSLQVQESKEEGNESSCCQQPGKCSTREMKAAAFPDTSSVLDSNAEIPKAIPPSLPSTLQHGRKKQCGKEAPEGREGDRSPLGPSAPFSSPLNQAPELEM